MPTPSAPRAVYLDLALIFLLLRWRRLCLFFFHFHRISAGGGGQKGREKSGLEFLGGLVPSGKMDAYDISDLAQAATARLPTKPRAENAHLGEMDGAPVPGALDLLPTEGDYPLPARRTRQGATPLARSTGGGHNTLTAVLPQGGSHILRVRNG